MSLTEVKSTVSKVTCYTDRAMVTRKAKVELTTQQRSIQITQLPPRLDQDSLRISARGTGGMTILDFKISNQEYREVPETALKTLEEERLRFLDNIAAIRDEISTIEHQKGFLKEIGVGKTRHFSKDLDVQRPLLDDWKAVLEFLGREQRDLDAQRREAETKIRKLESDIRMIDAELKKYGSIKSKSRKVVTVELEVKADGEFEFELSYLIHEAQWRPMYDARVDSKAKKVGMRYYGVVTQTTGENWTNVEVLLSTARPQLGGNAPVLSPWYVAPNVPMAVYSMAPPAPRGMMKKMAMSAEEAMDEEGVGGVAESVPYREADQNVATVEAGQGSSVVFRTGGGGDVPGDGSDAKLLIMDGDFENKFQYLTVPKLAELVFLTAEVTNSTEFPLLPGKISIFMDGNFVGNSVLQRLVSPGEKFELHLGVDESIRVIRKLQKRKGDEKGIFTKSHVEEFSYLLTLESNRDSAEEVVVRDQLPVSTDEKIKVETKTLTPAENPDKDKDKLPSGVLEWKINLEGRKTEKIEIGFGVSYPKDLEVTGL